MGEATTRKNEIRYDVATVKPPRWRALPPEIIKIIVEMLGKDRKALSACSLVSREFTFAALCRLGRRIVVNTARRLRECASLISEGSAFQHICSLDLGITTERAIRGKEWNDYLIILKAFARRRSLTCLWLSGVSFHFSKSEEQETFRNIIISLTATINELGLFSCRFSCYTELVSLIRAFPLCTTLYVRDCVAHKTPEPDAFAGLLQHTLCVDNLELTSSSGHKFLIDVSNLIKDAALDISSLTGFSCDMVTADVVRDIVMTVVASPVERLHLICDEAEGFHVLADPAVTRWPLESLIIGPLDQKNVWWCERALELNSNLPHLKSVSLLGCHTTSRHRRPAGYRFWTRVDQLLSREDIFPRLRRVDICIVTESQRLKDVEHQNVLRHLPQLLRAGKVYFWGERASLPIVRGTPSWQYLMGLPFDTLSIGRSTGMQR